MGRQEELQEQAANARRLAQYMRRGSDQEALLAFADGCDREREALDAGAGNDAASKA